MEFMLLVGTMKGAWIFRSDGSRTDFSISEPLLAGKEVYSFAYDAGNRRILAGTSSLHWGAWLQYSDDLGETWTEPEASTIKFPEGSDWTLQRIWQIEPFGDGRTILAGTEPAALFRSGDGGSNFQLVKGLYDHPHRKSWQPGGGGLCLHTIVRDPQDPQKIYIAISTGGVYRTLDGGESWEAANKGVRAEFLPDKYPDFGQCVHKIGMSSVPTTMYLQNHWGLYRTDDGADTWHDIANGVPSDFGFPLVVHPRDPDTAYVIPLESDRYRATPEGKCRVYRTRDGGRSWHPLTEGLPQENAHLTVLRDGFTSDSLEPAGLYFGTRNGKLFASSNEGDSWRQLAEDLPPIVCVKTAVVS